jgi:hypothetical protein
MARLHLFYSQAERYKLTYHLQKNRFVFGPFHRVHMKTFLDVIKSGFLRINSISVTVLSVQRGKTIFGSFPTYSRMSISPHLANQPH